MTTTTTWLSGDVQTNGIRMHYYRTGGDKPQLVLSHGATDDGLCWSRVARALESDYDVIMPDARGHGLTDAPGQAYTSADHAADLAGLIAALGLERPAIGGHSMGAGTTLRMVAEHPELVRCAFLEDPGFRSSDGPPPANRQDPRNSILAVVRDGRVAGRDATMVRGREMNASWDESEFGPWADAKLRVRDAFLDSMGTGGRPFQEWIELLPRVRRPLLLITSDPDRGGIVSPEVAQQAQQILPSLKVVRLTGAGHNIRREQFDGFVSCVREFLAAN
jgi:pimeloyl-ACP methyl ester carboxylesterase